MKEHSINIEGQNIFFRTKGKGIPIVLMHASPSSSKMFFPLIEKLANQFLVIAPDTPGYGNSQPLSLDFNKISDYSSFYKKFFQQIGLDKFSIYGTATGAQIGIRYALENEHHIAHLFLDNVAHFSDEQRSDILQNYFPDLSPQPDGSHLKKMWEIISGMFSYFPWFKKNEKYQLNIPFPPSSILHLVAKDFLAAGKNYHLAYQAAFEHERGDYVQRLKIPATIFDWEGSIIRPYLKQLLAFDFPKNIEIVETPSDRNLRLEKMVSTIKSKYTNGATTILPQFSSATKTSFDFSHFPKLEPDKNGDYLMDAWNYLLEKNKGVSVDLIQEKLKYWISSF